MTGATTWYRRGTTTLSHYHVIALPFSSPSAAHSSRHLVDEPRVASALCHQKYPFRPTSHKPLKTLTEPNLSTFSTESKVPFLRDRCKLRATEGGEPIFCYPHIS
jgi:hypothetical protein